MIFVDDNEVKVGGVTLPGLVKSLEIDDGAMIEEQDVEGSGKKPKQATGYEDAKINISLILEDGPGKTKLQKLEIIQNLFKKAGQSVPAVYDIVNEHTAARRITKVVFKQFSTKEDNKKEQITAVLEFWAYVPMKITAAKSKTSTTAAPAALNNDYKAYLETQRGTPPVSSSGTQPAASPLSILTPAFYQKSTNEAALEKMLKRK